MTLWIAMVFHFPPSTPDLAGSTFSADGRWLEVVVDINAERDAVPDQELRAELP